MKPASPYVDLEGNAIALDGLDAGERRLLARLRRRARTHPDWSDFGTYWMRAVADKLQLRLSGAEQQQLVKNSATNAEAYQLYLQGRYQWNKRTAEGLQQGIEYFKRAIEREFSSRKCWRHVIPLWAKRARCARSKAIAAPW